MDARTHSTAMSLLIDLIGLGGRARQQRAIMLWSGATAASVMLVSGIDVIKTYAGDGLVYLLLAGLLVGTASVRKAYRWNRALAAEAQYGGTFARQRLRLNAQMMVMSVMAVIVIPVVGVPLLMMFGHTDLGTMALAFTFGSALGVVFGAIFAVAVHDRPRASIMPREPRAARLIPPHPNHTDLILPTDTPPPRLRA